MRALGLDLGSKTLGMAMTDSRKIIASGIENFYYDSFDLKICLKKVQDVIQKYENDVDTIVLGYPLNVNGTKNQSTLLIEQFYDILLSNIPSNIKIVLSDERYTTKIASGMLKQAHLKNSQIRKIKDKISAVVILQGWLDFNTHD